MHESCCILVSVIDFCLTKTMLCDPVTNYPSLQLQWASKGNCEQRKGTTFCPSLIASAWNIGSALTCAVYLLTSEAVLLFMFVTCEWMLWILVHGGSWWSRWLWVGDCFFWYRPTRVVPDKETLNGCVCVCVCYLWVGLYKRLSGSTVAAVDCRKWRKSIEDVVY